MHAKGLIKLQMYWLELDRSLENASRARIQFHWQNAPKCGKAKTSE
jgi:hypothetical protein